MDSAFLTYLFTIGIVASFVFSIATTIKPRKPYVYSAGIAVAHLTAAISMLRALSMAFLYHNPAAGAALLPTLAAALIFALKISSNRRDRGLNL